MNKPCQARQYSDQMACGRCALAWDMNDHEPPRCLSDAEVEELRLSERLAMGPVLITQPKFREAQRDMNELARRTIDQMKRSFEQ